MNKAAVKTSNGYTSNFLQEQAISSVSFAEFKNTFALQGEYLYATLFNRHSDLVQTQKPKFALANLEKIFTTTFAISANSGFEKMSLRDLSKGSGMSMGAIYSCITKKEDIALMVADIVRLSSDSIRQYALKASSSWDSIEQTIRLHLYASALLQPWYFFLYFETRSLPEQQQAESIRIESDAIHSIEEQINLGVQSGEFHTNDAATIANMIVVMLEDWYLKPWKYQAFKPSLNVVDNDQEVIIRRYSQSLTDAVKRLLVTSL